MRPAITRSAAISQATLGRGPELEFWLMMFVPTSSVSLNQTLYGKETQYLEGHCLVLAESPVQAKVRVSFGILIACSR
jgi:hypothetical protein